MAEYRLMVSASVPVNVCPDSKVLNVKLILMIVLIIPVLIMVNVLIWSMIIVVSVTWPLLSDRAVSHVKHHANQTHAPMEQNAGTVVIVLVLSAIVHKAGLVPIVKSRLVMLLSVKMAESQCPKYHLIMTLHVAVNVLKVIQEPIANNRFFATVPIHASTGVAHPQTAVVLCVPVMMGTLEKNAIKRLIPVKRIHASMVVRVTKTPTTKPLVTVNQAGLVRDVKKMKTNVLARLILVAMVSV